MDPMTLNEIDKLEAGRNLDLLIHEHVFNNFPPPIANFTRWRPTGEAIDIEMPLVIAYSNFIGAAWLVLEKLGFLFNISRQTNGYVVVIYSDNPNLVKMDGNGIASGETAALAICRAALKIAIAKKS